MLLLLEGVLSTTLFPAVFSFSSGLVLLCWYPASTSARACICAPRLSVLFSSSGVRTHADEISARPPWYLAAGLQGTVPTCRTCSCSSLLPYAVAEHESAGFAKTDSARRKR